MTYTCEEINGIVCLVYNGGTRLSTENDINDIISAGFEHGANCIMLHDSALSDDFFRLHTGLAGVLLQKCANYHFKTALVLTDATRTTARFRELMFESNQGQAFAVFSTQNAAAAWLAN